MKLDENEVQSDLLGLDNHSEESSRLLSGLENLEAPSDLSNLLGNGQSASGKDKQDVNLLDI